MLHLKVNASTPNPAPLKQAADVLREGGIVAFPTDTFYGLAVDPANTAAVARLFEAKRRPTDRAVPLIAADATDVARVFGASSGDADRIARRFWPGPLSLVLTSPAVLAGVAAADGTVAVRVPANEVARALARMSGGLITATSANLSGSPPAREASAVVAALGDAVAVVLDAGVAPGGTPSTIVDARTRPVRLVRAGAVPWNRVLESLQ
jgi:L-threonylcarbamoyladenylate synthase